ncbi:hypothetical protein [Bacillus alkalicellulosilyticus]|nr:hypothetical protein [Bacillus alkalicellulosilyticus]
MIKGMVEQFEDIVMALFEYEYEEVMQDDEQIKEKPGNTANI